MSDDSAPLSLALFGASGDLARRKLLPALYRLHRAGKLPSDFRLVGYGRTPMDDDAFRAEIRDSLAEHGDGAPLDDASARSFLAAAGYVAGAYDDPAGLARLAARLSGAAAARPRRLLYYLALPPSVTETLLGRLAEGALPSSGARILLEKPFGVDLASARRANALLARAFPENAIHRIDHYLAKDTVRNLLVFRFANLLFEPVWNRHYIDHIQVLAAEALDVGSRAGFYDGVGVVRDMLQNHVLLMLALATLEPPAAGDPESLRDRLADLLRQIAPPAPSDAVFGQYEGYRAAPGVRPGSATPTYAAVRLGVDNWRWQGVPMYLVSGKAMAARLSEISVVFKRIPVCLLGGEGACANVAPNVLSLRIQPDEGMRLTLGVAAPGHATGGDAVLPAALDFRYADWTGEGRKKSAAAASGAPTVPVAGGASASATLFTGYERVLLEALAGRPDLFWRADGIEAAWKIVEPLLGRVDLAPYAKGTWGPDAAQRLWREDGRTWIHS